MFDWIQGFISQSGYLGIVGLMLAENIFPPIPSEVVMPLAGFVAAQGQLNPVLVVLAGTLGSILGALPWYYAGVWLGEERVCRLAARHGRWIAMNDEEVGHAIRWFDRHGGMAVLLGRLVPAVRTVISLPAGLARMPLVPFLLYSTIGTVIWTSLLAAAGYLLKESYTLVSGYLDSVSKIIVSLIVLTYVWRVIAGGRLGARVRGWAESLRQDVQTIYLSWRDRRVPWYARGLALLVAAYAVSPVDLIPDVIPVIGHLDDVILLPLGILAVMRLMPEEVLAEHRERARAGHRMRTSWRVGALFIAIWLIALAFVGRWLIAYLSGGSGGGSTGG